jgi:integrase
MAGLRAQEGVATRALEFTIPDERMKAGREYRVPLSDAAIGLLEELQNAQRGEFVFPSGKSRRPISNMAMTMTLRRMGGSDLTVHGFRSTFKDWAGDCTRFERDIVEEALAHTLPNKTEKAYRRSDALEKRRGLMQAWARYCATQPAANT